MVNAISLRFCATWLLFIAVVVAQPHRNSQTAPGTTHNQGLLDFALHGINPDDLDYGRCVDDVRHMVIQETIDRAYFWSNLVAVAIAVCLFVVIVHMHRVREHREVIAAQTLTQCRNALVRAEAQVQEVSRKNHALMDALLLAPSVVTGIPMETGNVTQVKPRRAPGPAPASVTTVADVPGMNAKKEITPVTAGVTNQGLEAPAVNVRKAPVSPSSKSKPGTMSGEAPTTAVTNVQTAPLPAVVDAQHRSSQQAQVVESRPAAASSRTASPEAARTIAQMALFSSDVDLVARINTLQQQLNTSQEKERHLRRQLNDSELRAQKEREKTRNLQG